MQGRELESARGWGTAFNHRNRESHTEKVTFELRLEGGEALSL